MSKAAQSRSLLLGLADVEPAGLDFFLVSADFCERSLHTATALLYKGLELLRGWGLSQGEVGFLPLHLVVKCLKLEP